jgi:Heterokaryon incompatibility protein (HET)
MWLLNTSTIILTEFVEGEIPPYAILSHTWEKEEVSFQLIRDPDRTVAKSLKGYTKVIDSCAQAVRDNFQWIWIDTCCIDKSSSADLSEAINSMFRWYHDARVCFAYLADVPDDVDIDWPSSAFHRSKWFNRGWTLQELLAPSLVFFFTSGWRRLGSKTGMRKHVSRITKIDESVLSGQEEVFDVSIATRMSWAATRKTTRTEDIAYCLLGIFKVNMPLLYGEGSMAFRRLQEEIIKGSDDLSIFAWKYNYKDTKDLTAKGFVDDYGLSGFLARDPIAFQDTGVSWVADELSGPVKPYTMTNKGLRMEVKIIRNKDLNPEPQSKTHTILILACRPTNNTYELLGIPVFSSLNGKVVRIGTDLFAIDRSQVQRCHQQCEEAFLFTDTHIDINRPIDIFGFLIRHLPAGFDGNSIKVYSPGTYYPDMRVASSPRLKRFEMVINGKYVFCLDGHHNTSVFEQIDPHGASFNFDAYGLRRDHKNFKQCRDFECTVGEVTIPIKMPGIGVVSVYPIDITAIEW